MTAGVSQPGAPPSSARTEKPTPSDLARGGAIGLAGSITGSVMGLLLVIVLGNMLGDTGAGVVLQAIAVFTVALAVGRFGMDSTALWLLPRLREDSPEQVRAAVRLLLLGAAAAGLASAAVLYLTAGLIPTDQSSLNQSIRSVAWALPIAATALVALAVSRALGGLRTYALIGNVVLPTSRVLAVLIAAGAGLSTTGVAAAWAVMLVPALLLALGAVHRQLAFELGSVPRQCPRELPGRVMRFGLLRVVSAVLEQMLLWLDVVLVGLIAGPAAAGVYGAASRLVMAGTVVDTAIRTVVSPWFSRAVHRKDTAGLADIFRTATTWLVLFGTPIHLLLACFAPLPLSLVGPEFASGASVVTILCIGAIVTFLAGNVHSLLVMSGRSGLAATNKAIAVAVNLGLVAILVPRWGIVGAAIAWSAATMLDAALAGTQVRSTLHQSVWSAAAFRPLTAGLITVGLPALLCRVLLGATWTSLAVALAVGAAAFIVWIRRDAQAFQIAALTSIIRRPTAGAAT